MRLVRVESNCEQVESKTVFGVGMTGYDAEQCSVAAHAF